MGDSNRREAAAVTAGAWLRAVGVCHLAAGLCLCWPVWAFARRAGAHLLGICAQPGHAIVWFGAIVGLIVIGVAAVAAGGALLGVVLIHAGLGRAVARGSRGAATGALVVVGLELAAWAFAAFVALIPADRGPVTEAYHPGLITGSVAVLMAGISALLLAPLLRVRRPSGPPPLPLRVLPV